MKLRYEERMVVQGLHDLLDFRAVYPEEADQLLGFFASFVQDLQQFSDYDMSVWCEVVDALDSGRLAFLVYTSPPQLSSSCVVAMSISQSTTHVSIDEVATCGPFSSARYSRFQKQSILKQISDYLHRWYLLETPLCKHRKLILFQSEVVFSV